MNQSALLKLAQRILGETFASLGFRYENGIFCRELPSGVLNLVGPSLDPRTKDTFRIMSGLNSRLIFPKGHLAEIGVFADQHITPSGFGRSSGFWPCQNEAAAIDSLTKINHLLTSLVEPWFQKHTTLSDLASFVDSEMLPQGLWKAKLYKEDGDAKRAHEALNSYRERLSTPKPWDDPKELAAEKRKVDALAQELDSL